ncbi:phosphatidate cytidylyltransferase [Ferruginibacter sp.]|nr:phosphatidate cytidylyltransferase [Ferruginibacter sp.]
MALNLATLKTRSLTAVVFVAVMLAGLLWNFTSFWILFSIIQIGCWLEYLKLVEKIYNTQIDIFIKWVFAICGFTLMIVFGFQYYWTDTYSYIFSFKVSYKVLFWILELICLYAILVQNKKIDLKVKWMSLGGFLYVTLPFTLFLNTRDNTFFTNEEFNLLELGKIYTCCIMFSIWINDTMAYIVGSLIGKTPFSKISPKKTWEGTIGGAILCIVVIATIAYFTNLIAVKDAAIIAALCAIFGTIGDLFESKLKRMANVKDSGAIMPGHGGFLDRFDSLLFAAPAVWLFVKLFM